MPAKLRRSFLMLLIASVAAVSHAVAALDPGVDPLSPEHLTLRSFPSAQLALEFFPVALSLASTRKPFDLAVLRRNSFTALGIHERNAKRCSYKIISKCYHPEWFSFQGEKCP
ncbi:hypothetical protein ABZP36_007856 [Zizania latifolia]